MEDNAANSRRLLDRESLSAFAIYLGLSLLFFGRGLIGHFSDRYIGVGPDPASSILYAAWLRHAFTDRLNPFRLVSIWTPEGLNLAHTAYPPLTEALLAALSPAIGIVAAYNTIALLAPALSAWPAFILCRRICGSPPSAIAGGFIFGFSPFILGHLLGQMNLFFGGIIPIAIYLALLRLDEEIGAQRFAALMTLVLLGQFGCSLELLATMTLFGAIALALALRMGGADLRRRIIALAPPLAIAYAATAVIASPYLYYFFAGGAPELPRAFAVGVVAEPMNFLIPTPVNLLGTLGMSRFLEPSVNIYDMTAYIGIPAILVVFLMALRMGDELKIKLPVAMLAILSVLSLGAILVVGRHFVPMPGIVFLLVPLLKSATPARCAAFAFLCIAVIFTLWLGDRSYRPATRAILGALVLISLAPNLNASFWTTNVDTPDFFRNGSYRKYLAPNENVLLLPYGVIGNTDLWQTETNFYFRMAGGYLGITPAVPQGYRGWPIVPALYSLAEIPDMDRQMKAFLLNKRVSKVIVPDQGAHLWQWRYGDGPVFFRLRPFSADEQATIDAFFAPIDPSPLHIGGVTIYRVPLERLGAYAQYTLAELQIDAARAKLRTLIAAANQLISQGRNPADLNLVEAARLGLLPHLWITGPIPSGYPRRPGFLNGLILRPAPEGKVEVGLSGHKPALQKLKREYAPYCRAARLLGPQPSLNFAQWTLPVLLLDFDRAGLAQAAALVVPGSSAARGRSAWLAPNPIPPRLNGSR